MARRAKIYSGVGIDIPGNGATFPSNPEGVYEATRKAFEAGAAGVLISREYDEMRLPNLRAVGRAIRDLGHTSKPVAATTAPPSPAMTPSTGNMVLRAMK